MTDVMKIIKCLEESSSLMEDVSETIKTEVKEQEGGFPNMLVGTLCASSLGNLLTGIVQLKLVKEQLELPKTELAQARIFYATSSFNKC